jgi:putative N6-adenine-specific DNA methylase
VKLLNRDYIAKTFFGLEEVLAKEIADIGGTDVRTSRRAVFFKGNEAMMYKANLRLRAAVSILLPILKVDIENQQDLYDVLRNYNWEGIMSTRKTFSVDSVCHSKIFTHSKYLAYRAKDAIADYFRGKYGARPDVDTKHPDIKINVHLSGKSLTVSLDSSGEPLFKRGYRKYHGVASLNEVLAAGIIYISGWNKEEAFINPMCGSGTFGIEAALMAKNIAPGIFRDKYGFETWSSFNKKMFGEIYEELEEETLSCEIICSDISGEAIEGSKQNVAGASLTKNIRVLKDDFFTTEYNIQPATVILNPPYGERMKEEDITEFYKNIGNTLKKNYLGCNIWIISSHMEALKNIGLKTSRKIQLFNGPIECKLHHYEVYEGTRKV